MDSHILKSLPAIIACYALMDIERSMQEHEQGAMASRLYQTDRSDISEKIKEILVPAN